MAITVTISPTGLILESEARKNPNFDWDAYLDVSPVTLSNGDQLLIHVDLDNAWRNWLLANFDGPDAGLRIDLALDPVLLNNPWSLEHGIIGTLELIDEDYTLLAEKIDIPIETGMITFAITS
jgi:hypothetical protein